MLLDVSFVMTQLGVPRAPDGGPVCAQGRAGGGFGPRGGRTSVDRADQWASPWRRSVNFRYCSLREGFAPGAFSRRRLPTLSQCGGPFHDGHAPFLIRAARPIAERGGAVRQRIAGDSPTPIPPRSTPCPTTPSSSAMASPDDTWRGCSMQRGSPASSSEHDANLVRPRPRRRDPRRRSETVPNPPFWNTSAPVAPGSSFSPYPLRAEGESRRRGRPRPEFGGPDRRAHPVHSLHRRADVAGGHGRGWSRSLKPPSNCSPRPWKATGFPSTGSGRKRRRCGRNTTDLLRGTAQPDLRLDSLKHLGIHDALELMEIRDGARVIGMSATSLHLRRCNRRRAGRRGEGRVSPSTSATRISTTGPGTRVVLVGDRESLDRAIELFQE